MSQMGSYSRVRYLDCVFKSFVVVQACVKIHFSLNSTTPRLKKKKIKKKKESKESFPVTLTITRQQPSQGEVQHLFSHTQQLILEVQECVGFRGGYTE